MPTAGAGQRRFYEIESKGRLHKQGQIIEARDVCMRSTVITDRIAAPSKPVRGATRTTPIDGQAQLLTAAVASASPSSA
jgi:hypothetical protein